MVSLLYFSIKHILKEIMYNLSLLEECFKKFIKNITFWSPEIVIPVNLTLLHQLGLLNYYNRRTSEQMLTRYFQVIESIEKITLVNDDFVVWIVPDKIENIALTYTLIAVNKSNGPELELAFVASGAYNSSSLVLRILEKYLFEIQETEDFLSILKKNS